ncbi:hypothetical protein F5Y15DRAFT_407920 [Xylariaceae sp. FL0016]|nr:hypothetical protein F5Y15DRAFT_407920 [Xylariaceae sp. FL0016]
MKRIRQALARVSRARQPEADLIPKTISTASSTTISTDTLRTARRSLEADTDAPGPLVLYDGSQRGRTNDGIDIIFIHCLGGSRIKSWQKDGVCWPRDLLGSEMPDSRIISWGWSLPDTVKIDQYATALSETLLRDLSKVCGNTDRDIVFVAHGLGGTIVKDALATIATSQVFGKHVDLGRIYPRTVGIIFLGTPHRGVGRQTLGEAVAAVAQIETRRRHDQFTQMAKNNELLETQRGEFILVSRDIHVVCARGVLPMPDGMVVPKASAIYDGLNVTVDDIYANHLDMARFATRQDPGYFQLVGHISKLSRRAKIQDTEARMMRNREILEALYFDMGEQEDQSDQASRQTSSWLLSSKEGNESISGFHGWLQSPGPIFWISGNAASGKSTSMKYAFHDPKTREMLEQWAGDHQLIIAAVFLREGGSHVQKSREGILRGTLHQILSAHSELIPVCFPSFMTGPWPPPIPFNGKTNMVQTTVNLSQAFYQLFSRMSDSRLRLCMFIDGLDEYRLADQEGYAMEASSSTSVTTAEDGEVCLGSSKWITDSHAEIARLVTDLGSQEHVKLCVSSRELPTFQEAFRDCPNLRVHLQTQKFISKYCRDRLDDVAPGLSDSQSSLCDEVARKSRGDMLWARLAMDILMEGSLKRLRTTLDTLPTQLFGPKGIYMRMVSDLAPQTQRAACRIVNIVLKAQDPPSLVTLAFAEEGYMAGPKQRKSHPNLGELLITHDKLRPFTREELEQISDRMERRLETSCAGLLEKREKTDEVVFMHLTAKEFVFKGEVWDQINVTPPNKIEVYFSLLSGTLRYLRCLGQLRPIVSKYPGYTFTPEAWLLISNTLKYADRVGDEPFDPQAYCELLDELDLTCHEIWTQAVKEHAPRVAGKIPTHWSGCEPMELGASPTRRDFLALAIQANLYSYVAAKLERMEPGARRAKAQALLEYAVCPESDTRASNGASLSACVSRTGNYRDFHHDMPSTRFVKLLFEHGAVANSDSEGAAETWAKTVRLGRSFFDQHAMVSLTKESTHALNLNRRRWIAAVQAMLLHGADPHMQIVTGGDQMKDGSVKMQPALEAIRETLEADRDFAKDLIEIEASAMVATGMAL